MWLSDHDVFDPLNDPVSAVLLYKRSKIIPGFDTAKPAVSRGRKVTGPIFSSIFKDCRAFKGANWRSVRFFVSVLILLEKCFSQDGKEEAVRVKMSMRMLSFATSLIISSVYISAHLYLVFT